jgi:hypothetical protein
MRLGTSLGGVLLLGLLMTAGSAQALTVTTASLGAALGCTDNACINDTLTLGSGTAGSGTLDISGSVLTFSITLPSYDLVPSQGADDNGVTQLNFTNVTYTGTASLFQSGPVYAITGGSTSISGTQTPVGAGTGGAFSASNSLLGGQCTDLGTSVVCGITISPQTDFNFDVNGQTRHFSQTMNLTAVVPEPGAAVLFAVGLAGLAARRRMVKA